MWRLPDAGPDVGCQTDVNVRGKLSAAEQAVVAEPRYAVNVAELRNVIPRDLTPAEIDARLGASWISAEHVSGPRASASWGGAYRMPASARRRSSRSQVGTAPCRAFDVRSAGGHLSRSVAGAGRRAAWRLGGLRGGDPGKWSRYRAAPAMQAATM